MVPLRALCARLKYSSFLKLSTSVGIEPVSQLLPVQQQSSVLSLLFDVSTHQAEHTAGIS